MCEYSPQLKGEEPTVEMVRVLLRGHRWVAISLSEHALLPAGEVAWEIDSSIRAMTSFGLPGHSAKGSRDFADASLVVVFTPDPEVCVSCI